MAYHQHAIAPNLIFGSISLLCISAAKFAVFAAAAAFSPVKIPKNRANCKYKSDCNPDNQNAIQHSHATPLRSAQIKPSALSQTTFQTDIESYDNHSGTYDVKVDCKNLFDGECNMQTKRRVKASLFPRLFPIQLVPCLFVVYADLNAQFPAPTFIARLNLLAHKSAGAPPLRHNLPTNQFSERRKD